jgi:ABC-2 type transport system ATP-binding protein
MTFLLRLLTLVALLSLTACTTFHPTPPTLLAADGQTLEKTWYNAEAIAGDGSRIRMTVYQPALKKGETAPLLLHAHGFGLGRMARPLSFYGKLLLAGKSSLRAWDEGFWVISYDQRGQGSSDGRIGLMDVEKEPRDVSAVIDWAVKNLALSQKNGDPLVGMIGESYGGGVQMSATLIDPRIDALIPITTWYNLDTALFPNHVPKTDWLAFLGFVGYARSPFHMDNAAFTGSLSEVFGSGDPALHQRLYNNSMAAHCGAGEGPHADALLIQGMRDVLFPLNQALDARQCFLAHGRDVRLIAVEHGHLMPGSQSSPGLSPPIWHVQETVRCDGRIYRTADIIDDWLNGKLRNNSAALARVPRDCISGEAALDEHLPALSWQNLPAATSHNGATGWLEFIARPLDQLLNIFTPGCLPPDYVVPTHKQPMLADERKTGPSSETSEQRTQRCMPANWQEPSDGWLRPARIPVLAVTQPTWIIGVPKLSFSFTGENRPNATLFLRLAAWTPNSGSYRVLSQQVTPVRADGRREIELGAVRDKLLPGEILGLLVQGHSNQFRFGGSGIRTRAGIAGKIGLPLTAASDATPYTWNPEK